MRIEGYRCAVLLAAILFVSSAYARDSGECDSYLAGQQLTQQQWLEWEETANVEKFIQSTAKFALPLVEISSESVRVWTSAKIPQDIKKMFLRGDRVAWPKHFFNQDAKVPHFNVNSTESFPVRLTASRSVVDETKWMSIKMPTDHPHGPHRAAEPEKVDLSQDIHAAIIREEHIQRVDAKLGKDPMLILLPEVLALEDKKSRNGILVRDLSAMNDGNYYLPATSIPIVGHEIAARNDVAFEKFWKEAFAEAVGRAKAKLLLRYGLEMETPNAQNFLIQLDRNFKPTGAVVIRDTADSEFIGPVAAALGFEAEMAADREAGFNPKDKVFVNWWNTHFRFNESRNSAVAAATIDYWGAAHDAAYFREVENVLNVKINKKRFLPDALRYWKEFVIPTQQPDEILNAFFRSAEGVSALRQLRF